MGNSVPAYLWEDKDYQEEVAWKVLGFFFPLSHHLQHGQISHHPRQVVPPPPETSNISEGEDSQTMHLQENDKQNF